MLKTCSWIALENNLKSKQDAFKKKLENTWNPEKLLERCGNSLEVWKNATIA